jgi:hypothetical protein
VPAGRDFLQKIAGTVSFRVNFIKCNKGTWQERGLTILFHHIDVTGKNSLLGRILAAHAGVS